jgi:phospholipase D1/2
MATAPQDPQVRIERTVHQICTPDGTPYQAWATARLWVADADAYAKTDGNAITPYTTGRAYYADLAQAIASASSSVCMLGWQINWDVMLVPGKRLYDVLLQALKARPALKAYILPWNDTNGGPDTSDDDTKAVLEHINTQLGGAPRIFVTLATEMPAATAGLDSFYSHHQKQVVIDNLIAFVGGIDVCWGRNDDATFDLNAATRLGDDAYNGCVPHLAPVSADETFVDAQRVAEPDAYFNPDEGGTRPNHAAQHAKANLAQGGAQRPQGGAMLDAKRQPRMPWQDVHLRVQGPAVSDLASNFVLRWNSVNPQRLRLPLPPPPKAYAKPGTCSMQMLRSASHKMVEAELKATAAADKPRVHGASGHNHIHHAYVRLIEQAEHFIYIENQFFVSAYGSPGYGDGVSDADAPKPSAEVRSATPSAKKTFSRAVPGDADALPTNRICEALGEKIGDMILDRHHPPPDGKASPFHVYITLPVHSEGRLDDASTMTQVHNTMQSLVYGSHSLVNRIRRAIKARQLCVQNGHTSDWMRAFHAANTEYTSVPIDWCWAYLTLLNLRNWAMIGGHPVTEQIYVHTKMMVVDDRFAIVGSANINDRSMLGNRDSELAVLVMDTDFTYEDIGSPDGPTVVRKFARELRMKVWEKIFGNTGGVRAAGLKDAIARPAAQSSWENIRVQANLNTQKYEAAFAFIPANGRGIWPTVTMEGNKRARGLMPFDTEFWAAPQHAEGTERQLEGIKGYITLLPWRWPVVRQGNGEILQNNNSGMHSALFTDNSGTSQSQDLQPVRLGAADNKSSEEYPA